MIEVNLEMEVSAKELFDVIVPSVIYDIKQATGKSVNVSALHDNYTYKKKLKSKMGKDASVRVTITRFTYPTIYEAEFDSGAGKTGCVMKSKSSITEISACRIWKILKGKEKWQP